MAVHNLFEEKEVFIAGKDEVDALLESIKQKNIKTATVEEQQAKEDSENSKKQYREFSIEVIPNNCYSVDLYNKIKSLGWEIVHYFKLNRPVDEYSYNEVLEKYECKYNNWNFEIRHLQDVDIEQGIWGVYEAVNSVSGEDVKFYCDIGCRNTFESRLERFCGIIESDSVKEYVGKTFGKYLAIPIVMSAYGYDIKMEKPLSNLDIIKDERIVYKVENGCYIVVYRGIFDDIKMVVTNNPNWNINSSNTTLGKKRAYYIDYNGYDDTDLLDETINLFLLHINGGIGYLMQNGEKFTNEKINEFFMGLKGRVPYDTINHYHMQVKYHDINDHCGYAKVNHTPSILSGLEIYSEAEVIFNDAAQWSVGDTAFNLVFIYEYNSQMHNSYSKQGEGMHLRIYGYKINNNNNEFEFKDKEVKEAYYSNEYMPENEWEYAKLDIDEEYVGTPEQLMDITVQYLKNTAKYFDIKENFKNIFSS